MISVHKVLIFDSGRLIGELISEQLVRSKEFKPICVDEGMQALSLITQEYFDVIIISIVGDDISGKVTSQKIRETGVVTPIVFLVEKAFDQKAFLFENLGIINLSNNNNLIKGIKIK